MVSLMQASSAVLLRREPIQVKSVGIFALSYSDPDPGKYDFALPESIIFDAKL